MFHILIVSILLIDSGCFTFQKVVSFPTLFQILMFHFPINSTLIFERFKFSSFSFLPKAPNFQHTNHTNEHLTPKNFS
jgi:hypothetical protein